LALFTATLREEIDLEQVRERFLTVVQQTMHPSSVALWVRTERQLEQAETFFVAEDDPFVAYALDHPNALALEGIHLTSPLLQDLQAQGIEVVLPLASQGELIGFLTLGSRMVSVNYRRFTRAIITIFYFFSPIHLILLFILGPRMDDDIYASQDLATLSS